MRRAGWPLLAGLGLLVMGAAAFMVWQGRHGRKDWNVLLVTVDTLRADHLGVYGYARDTSPNVDALARESVVFRRAFSQASETNPSLSALMTSHYTHETSVYRNFHRLPASVVTLAEILKGRGFRTGAVVTNFSLRHGSGLEQGFDDYDDDMTDSPSPKWEGIERNAAKATPAALSWLRKHGKERFFLWLHYMDPHAPYAPPPPYDTMFPLAPSDLPGMPASLPFLSGGLGTGGIPEYAQLGTETDPRYYVSRYDGEIRFFDRGLGEIMEELRAQGLLENTLVVLTADHGEGMGAHDYWFNHPEFIYDGLIHVPLLVRLPNAPEHREVTTPVGLVDLLPTILAALSLEPHPGARGRDLLDPHGTPRPILSASYMFGMTRNVKLSLIEGNRKLLVQGGKPFLYDLTADFDETRDLLAGGDPAELATSKAMTDRLAKILSDDALRNGQPVQWDILPESVQKLRALGYVE